MVYDSQQIGKFLILAGVFVALLGAMIMISGRTGLFKLPGDFVFSGKNWRIYLPIASSIIMSVVLTFIAWLINYLRK